MFSYTPGIHFSEYIFIIITFKNVLKHIFHIIFFLINIIKYLESQPHDILQLELTLACHKKVK